jgi:hypothetical protein
MSVDVDMGEGGHDSGGEPGENHEEIQAEARQLGWVPKDEFRGNEKHWVDADAFLERGQQILPILKQNNKALQSELRTIRAELDETKLTLRESSEMFKQMSTAAYNKALADVKAQIRQAQNNGDYDVADQLTDQYDQLKEDAKNVKAPGSARAADPQAEQIAKWNGIVSEWKDETAWYGKDKTLTRQLDGIAQELAAADPSLRGTRRLLDKAEKQLREEMPEKFTNPRRASGSPVSGAASSSAGAGRASQAVRDLPADAKASGQRMVKNGVFKDMAEYAKAYFDDTNGIIS